jgi:L-malate glycosyltransferase
MKKQKILILENSHSFTGAFKAVFSLTQQLRSHFDFIFCISSKSQLKVNLEKENFRYVTLPFLELSKSFSILFYFPVLIYNSIKLSNIIRKGNIDTIHVNDLYNMTGVITKILYPKIRLIYHVRLMADSYVKRMYPLWVKIIVRVADCVVCNSMAVKRGLLTASTKVKVIYDLPPDSRHTKPRNTERDNPVILLYLANFIPGKGHNYAIEAFANAVKTVPEMRMILSGGDLGRKSNSDYKQALIRKVEELQIAKKISFTDFEADVEKVMREATIFLNFSESESFSLTCLEALWFGVPLIATDCGGPAEIFESERSGILVRNRNVNDMTAAIIRLSNTPELRSEFSGNGLRFVFEKFNRSRLIDEYITLYENLKK